MCKRGNRCKLPHTDEQLDDLLRMKRKKCPGFFDLGFCSYGPHCQFSHQVYERKGNNPTVSTKSKKHDKDWWEGPGLA
jgi:hypothetical protein